MDDSECDPDVGPFDAGPVDSAAGGTALACLAAALRAADPERAVAAHLALDGDDLVVESGGSDPESGGSDPESGGSDPESGGSDPESEGLGLESEGLGLESEGLGLESEDSDRADGGGTTVRYDLDAFDRVVVVGGGKAVPGLVDGLERLLGDRLDGGAVVVPADAADAADPDDVPDAPGRVARLPGDHPEPSERGVRSTERVRALAADADERTLVLAVVTGGGSALLAAPAAGLDLSALRATTRALLDAGATVAELNAVRKHCSALKGGGLAALASPATTLTLVVSDVVGDDVSTVASGPTAPDPTTFGDALAVLERYDADVPASVRAHLERGARGELSETPGPDHPAFGRCRTVVVADGRRALAAGAERARERGYTPCLLTSRDRGEARELARPLVAVAEETAATGSPVAPPAVLLAGGEATVTVTGDGTGGPNLELALSAALELAGSGGVALASVDSDGRDGSTDAAGALVGAATVPDREAAEAARTALAANDALPYLAARDALLHTGPTGTNVDDLRVVVVPSDG